MYNTRFIKNELLKKSMSQKDLANETELCQGTISRILLTGRSSFDSIKKICSVLDISIDEILEDKEM